VGAAYFYHLTDQPLEVTLPMLLGKARGAGWRVVVRGVEEARMRALDERLWQGAEADFLPHGCAGGPHDAEQPILLSWTAGDALGACLMSVDGADVSVDEVSAQERVCILFDGLDPDAVARARVQWKTLSDAGVAAQYWAQDQGRWTKKAESGGEG
jgi:DNA polymerase-3 subunit chi